MYSSTTPISQGGMRQPINITGLRHSSNQQQASIPQLPSRQFMGVSQSPIQSSFGAYGGFPSPVVSQPFYPSPSPGVAATNCYPSGFALNQQQQFHTPGRSQPVYSPGVAATNCFPTGNVPYQQQFVPQARTYGGQYSLDAFAAPVQSQFMANNAASTFAPPRRQVQQQQIQQQQIQQQQQQQQQQRDLVVTACSGEYVDLTGDDKEEVQTAASVAPNVPVPVPAAEKTALPTPDRTPSPEAARHLSERVSHLKLTIHERFYPCAFRLLRSFDYLDIKLRRKYCALFWPSNEVAREDMLEMAKLSPEFSVIYTYRMAWHSRETKPKKDEDPESVKKRISDERAELQRTCKIALQDRISEEGLSQLHQTLITTKGKKRGAALAARKEEYREENERVQGEKRERWAKLDAKLKPRQTSNALAGDKRKRADEEPAPAPAPKKRGRPKKVRPVEEEGVVKEKKKRGRPRKVVQVQEPIPDHTNEAGDDGSLEAAIIAGLSEEVVELDEAGSSLAAQLIASFADDDDDDDDDDAVNVAASAEPSCQLQGQEQESGVAAAIADDLPAACSEEAPATENAARVDSLFPEQAQEGEGCVDPATDIYDLDSLFGDDPVAAHVEEGCVDEAMEDGDDKDSLFDDSDSTDNVEVDRLPQEQVNEEAADLSDPLAEILAFAFTDDGSWRNDSFLFGDTGNDIGE